MNDKKALELFNACLNEMYQASIPSTTWAEVQKKYIIIDLGDGKEHRSILAEIQRHEITLDDYDRIKKKYYEKLDKMYQRQLDWFLLDYSPRFKWDEKKVIWNE